MDSPLRKFVFVGINAISSFKIHASRTFSVIFRGRNDTHGTNSLAVYLEIVLNGIPREALLTAGGFNS